MAQSYYTPFVVDHTQCGSADSSNFPVVLAVTDARFKSIGNGGHVANSSGSDFRLYADTGLTTALTQQLRSYNATTGAVELVGLVPTLSHTTDTPLYGGYGDAALTTDVSSTGVWDASFKLVVGFGDGSTLNANDLTSNAHTPVSTHGTTASAGVYAGAASFDGSTNYIDYGNVTDLNFGAGNFTVSAWLKGGAFSEGVICKDTAAGTGNGLYLFTDNNPNVDYAYYNGSGITGGGAYSSSVWHRVSWVRSSTAANGVTGYYDSPGGTTFSGTDGRAFSNTSPFTLGAFGSAVLPFAGQMAELRVSAVARSVSWETAEYHNGLSPATFAPMGTEVPLSSGTNVSAGVGSLIATGFAPTVAATANQSVLAGAGVVTATGIAPVVAVSNNQHVLAGVGAATVTGFAPTVSAPNNITVLAGAGSAVLTGAAPTVSATANHTVAAGVGAVGVAGFAPTVTATGNTTVAGGVGLVTATGFAPSVVATGNQFVAPGVGLITVSGFAPTVAVSNNQQVSPGTGLVTVTSGAPTVTASNRVVVLAGVAIAAVAGFAPSVFATNPAVVAPGCGVLTLTAFAPSIVIRGAIPTLGPNGQFTLTAFLAARFAATDVQARFTPDVP